MDNLIYKKFKGFKAQAYQGRLCEVARQDIMGRWPVFLFYPADIAFIPRGLGDLYEGFKETGCGFCFVSEDPHGCARWKMRV